MVGLNLLLPLHQLESDAFINVVDNLLSAAEDWSRKLDTLNAEAEERTRQAVSVPVSGNEDEQTSGAPPDMLRV